MQHISKQQTPKFSLGIEEEYWIVDKKSNNLIQKAPKEFLQRLKSEFKDQVTNEFLQSQVEIGTSPNVSIDKTLDELKVFRGTISFIANKYDMDVFAASTHPFADYRRQKVTEKRRYSQLANDLQEIANRMLICGMHVHIGLDDNDLKIDLMNQMIYFLPHILALTTSSPFYGARDTGLLSYRLSIFDNIPRTGLPSQFNSWNEYQKFLELLIATQTLEDGSKIWWDIRPNANWPTLEVRICDICTNVADTVAIASLIRCIFRFLYRMKTKNTKWRVYPNSLIGENRWRAQRYSFLEEDGLHLIDFGVAQSVNYSNLLDQLIEVIADDISFYECQEQIDHIRSITKRGTSANIQKQIYYKNILQGSTNKEALFEVVEWLKKETISF